MTCISRVYCPSPPGSPSTGTGARPVAKPPPPSPSGGAPAAAHSGLGMEGTEEWAQCSHLPGTQMAQEHPARLVHQQVPAERGKGDLSQCCGESESLGQRGLRWQQEGCPDPVRHCPRNSVRVLPLLLSHQWPAPLGQRGVHTALAEGGSGVPEEPRSSAISPM